MATATLRLPRFLGRLSLGALAHLGRISLMMAELFRGLAEWRIWLPRTFAEAATVGVGSLPIVFVIAAFAGAVTAFQAGYQWQTSLPVYVLGTLITETIVLELGPVLIGLVLAGRIGARYAAELGTMRVTEQIDALETMAVDPINYLIVPRIVAAAFAAPVLTMLFNAIALSGAYGVAVFLKDLSPGTFLNRLQYLVELKDLTDGLGKSVVIGFVVTLIAAFRGYRAEGGARGVGIATTQAVVGGLVAIFAIDYVYTAITLSNPQPRGGLGG